MLVFLIVNQTILMWIIVLVQGFCVVICLSLKAFKQECVYLIEAFKQDQGFVLESVFIFLIINYITAVIEGE